LNKVDENHPFYGIYPGNPSRWPGNIPDFGKKVSGSV
jgi:hypothetical protein